MHTLQKPELSDYNQLYRLSLGLIAIIILTALLVFCGWQWDVPAFTQVAPGLPTMNPMTALSFLLASFSFLILAFPSKSRSLDRLGYFMAASVLGFATIRLAGYFIPALASVDQILYRDQLHAGLPGAFPARMAFNTALCFVWWGIALLQLRAAIKANRLIHVLALMIGAVGCCLSLGTSIA